MIRFRKFLGVCMTLILVVACGGGTNLPTGPTAFEGGSRSLAGPLTSRATMLYSFGRSNDGADPEGNPLVVNGRFFGTTYCGGTYGAGCNPNGSGGGAVISIKPDGSDEKVVHSFGHGADGANPDASLTYLSRVLYTTTVYGGANGDGTVVAMTASGKERVVYSFKGVDDGANPYGPVVAVKGTLYGLTLYGGTGKGCGKTRCGTIFSLTPSGIENVLHSFDASKGDGAFPGAGVLDFNGTLYGTTTQGGKYGWGTFFSITTGGKEKVLYSFANGHDGGLPVSTPIALDGILYGTTYESGSCGRIDEPCKGTVFGVTTKGVEKALYDFAGGSNGSYPSAALIAVDDVLYGTTEAGGMFNAGTVFKITTKGNERVLSILDSADGDFPYGSLTYFKGKLYGFALTGGSFGDGTLFVVK